MKFLHGSSRKTQHLHQFCMIQSINRGFCPGIYSFFAWLTLCHPYSVSVIALFDDYRIFKLQEILVLLLANHSNSCDLQRFMGNGFMPFCVLFFYVTIFWNIQFCVYSVFLLISVLSVLTFALGRQSRTNSLKQYPISSIFFLLFLLPSCYSNSNIKPRPYLHRQLRHKWILQSLSRQKTW